MNEDLVTAREIAQRLGRNAESTRDWLHYVKRQGLVRDCGSRREPGRNGTAPLVYRWADIEAAWAHRRTRRSRTRYQGKSSASQQPTPETIAAFDRVLGQFMRGEVWPRGRDGLDGQEDALRYDDYSTDREERQRGAA